MTPGPRCVTILLILAAAGVLVMAVPEVSIVLMMALALVVVSAAAEFLQLRRVAVRVDRPQATAFSLGEIERYSMRVSTNAAFPVELQVRQIWPSLVAQPSSEQSGICRPGEVVQFDFDVQAIQRGVAELPPPSVRLTRWRLSERTTSAGEKAELAVTPNVAAVGRLHKQLNQFFLRGYGSRSAARLGKGREFDRMRNYVRGDELRDVAWKTTARHGRLIVREYRLDRSQDIVICLDSGHRMAARVGAISRLDHAVNASMMLTYICNRMEDKVGILSFASQVERGIPAGRGSAHLRQITRFVTGVRSSFRHTDYLAAAADVRRRVRHRSLIFLMTVLPEQEDHRDLVRAVRMLAPQHLVLIAAFSDPHLEAVSEILPATKVELARTVVAREIRDSRAALARELRSLGALVIDTPPESFSTDSVNAYLDVKRRQLL
jgi:uncharacterized protein (DUF58 family)